MREAPRSLASELDPELTRVMREEARSFGSRMRTYLEREWGAPDYVDESIWVWNLDRVRASGAAAPLRDAPR